MTSFRTLLLAVAAALALSACAARGDLDGATLYYGFTRLDPEAERIISDAWFAERDGKIVAHGAGAPPQVRFASRNDMSGRYVLPGLIDTHAHVTLGPVSLDVTSQTPVMSALYDDAVTEHNARMLLAHGVTTIRNPAGDARRNVEYREGVESGEMIGPEALVAGPVIDRMPFPFHGLVDIPSDHRSIESIVHEQADEGVDYIKLYHLLSEEDVAQGVAAAKARGVPTIGHLGVSWKKAAELGVDAIVHAMPSSADDLEPDARAAYLANARPGGFAFFEWWEAADLDGPVMREMIAVLVENDVHVDLTLIAFQLAFWGDDDEVREARLCLAHPDMIENWRTFRFDLGWGPEDYDRAKAVWPKVLRFAQMLHEAGVRLTLGTDQANPFVAPGASMVQEMALHEAAGISRWAILRMATSDAADILGLANRTGRIAPGLDADVAFVEENPLDGFSTLYAPALVLSNGARFDPQALIRDSAASCGEAERAAAASALPHRPCASR